MCAFVRENEGRLRPFSRGFAEPMSASSFPSFSSLSHFDAIVCIYAPSTLLKPQSRIQKAEVSILVL